VVGELVDDYELTEYWRSVLTGEDKSLRGVQQWLSRLPSPPRCKLCQAPFEGALAPVLRLAGFKPWELNQQMCRKCFQRIDSHQGGSEISVSLLFVDVRESTALAESLSPSEFTARLNVFYKIVLTAVDGERGIVDHMAGDGVMAMWIPAFVAESPSKHAIAAARKIIDEMRGRLPIGTGIHTGTSFVGVVGEGGAKDFTALGDAPNTASRLSGAAAAGDLVVSEDAAIGADLDTSTLRHELLDLKGKSKPFPVWIESVTEAAGS
jgi:adenylate cyclase